MDNNGSKLSDESEPPTELRLENSMDTSGMWFAAAVLFAVMAAGTPRMDTIVYESMDNGLSCLTTPL